MKPFVLLVFPALFVPCVAPAADSLLPSSPVVSIEQARAGTQRLVVWELANGGIEAQVIDATTHVTLSERVSLGVRTDESVEPNVSGTHTRPSVAGLQGEGDDAVFLVAWHAEILNDDGNSVGTEIIGQRMVVNEATPVIDVGPMLRISRVDDDTDPTAASESRSAPVVVANETEDEFLVLWTHWHEGRTLDADSVSHDEYFIFGQEIGKDGEFRGDPDGASWLDSLEAPLDDNGLHARRDADAIFLAAAPLSNERGYFLAWSDPSQEDRNLDGVNEDLPQLFTKRLPASLPDRDVDARNALGDSAGITKGTGRLALAPLPNGDGYLLAYEDTRGMSNLDGFVLDGDGKAKGDAFHLLGPMISGDVTFLLPLLLSVPEENRLMLYAAVGDHSIDGELPPENLPLENGRLVRRLLDPESPAFPSFGSDFETVVDEYPGVNIFFAAQAHAAGALPDGAGTVSFTAKPDSSEIVVHEFLFAVEPPPPPAPPPSQPVNGGNNGGGGAMFVLLVLLPLLRAGETVSRRMRHFVVASLSLGILMSAGAAQASPPDLELLYKEVDGASCYRSVMYREVAEIRIAKSWGKTPIPAGTPVEITELPGGWSGEVLTEGKIQYVRLKPAAFDTVSGISIGRVCMKFPAMSEEPQHISYVYDLVSSGSPIMANARPDDGVSNDELRAMIKRGERLKQRDIPGKPKQVEETIKTTKRLKDLFN